jgi:hypothetical protein
LLKAARATGIATGFTKMWYVAIISIVDFDVHPHAKFVISFLLKSIKGKSKVSKDSRSFFVYS